MKALRHQIAVIWSVTHPNDTEIQTKPLTQTSTHTHTHTNNTHGKHEETLTFGKAAKALTTLSPDSYCGSLQSKPAHRINVPQLCLHDSTWRRMPAGLGLKRDCGVSGHSTMIYRLRLSSMMLCRDGKNTAMLWKMRSRTTTIHAKTH